MKRLLPNRAALMQALVLSILSVGVTQANSVTTSHVDIARLQSVTELGYSVEKRISRQGNGGVSNAPLGDEAIAAASAMAIPAQQAVGPAESAANGTQEISPVPLPAAVWSFLLGLLGILGVKKRRQAPVEERY